RALSEDKLFDVDDGRPRRPFPRVPPLRGKPRIRRARFHGSWLAGPAGARRGGCAREAPHRVPRRRPSCRLARRLTQSRARLPGLPMRLIDRYLLGTTLRPLAISLVVVLAALLLERILRLFSLLVDRRGPIGLVLEMAANLIPHYLGLALPAA